MADFGIFTSNAEIQAYAGQNANSTSKAVTATDVYVLNIEATINAKTRFNWSKAFTAGLNVDVAGILSDLGAAMCASVVIMDDMSNFSSTAEAETMLDFLNNKINFNMSFLKEKENQTFINNA